MKSDMKRRQLLKGIGSAGAAGVAVGSAAARRPNAAEVTDEDLEVLRVLRDGEVVRTFEDPSVEELDRIHEQVADDEELVNQDDCCVARCQAYCCPHRCCLFGIC